MDKNSKDNKSQRLSFNRFRDVDINNLSKEDAIDYQLAQLMKSMIEVLEISIADSRQFTRARYNVLSAFHSFLEKYDKIKDSPDVK